MNTVTYLEQQLANLHAIFHDLVSDLSEAEWQARAVPGQNRVGFNIWHIPRTQDNVVQLWIRGEAEVFHQPAWAKWHAYRPQGIGVGITLAEADAVAGACSRAETTAYADAVHQEILTWLRQCTDDDLDTVPDALAHLASYPEYQTAGYLAEVNSLLNQPVWSLLMRPCIGHVHRHLGELELTKALLRARE
jgi:DinB superfamily